MFDEFVLTGPDFESVGSSIRSPPAAMRRQWELLNASTCATPDNVGGVTLPDGGLAYVLEAVLGPPPSPPSWGELSVATRGDVIAGWATLLRNSLRGSTPRMEGSPESTDLADAPGAARGGAPPTIHVATGA